MAAPRIEWVREKAARAGREVRFGMRLHVVSRDTPEQAWAEADRMLAGMPADAVAATQQRYARMDSVGQARMTSLHGGRRPRAGDRAQPVGRHRAGPGGCGHRPGRQPRAGGRADRRVRGPRARRVRPQRYPHLEEAWRVGEQVLPLLARAPATASV
jgi:alkanesulfonate monooxygenase